MKKWETCVVKGKEKKVKRKRNVNICEAKKEGIQRRKKGEQDG